MPSNTPGSASPPPWPTQIAYQDALQDPASAFSDPELRTAVPEDLTPFGLPQPITGQYANVYRMRTADGSLVAVRLFLRDVAGRSLVYAALREHLRTLGAPPPFLTPMDYQEQGIRCEGAWYPLVRMPWVAGVPLNAYVEAVLNEPDALRRLRRTLFELAEGLSQAQIAHGDLQHGNLLVEPETGALSLVDYDGVFVPALAGRVAGREAGHPAYQHPGRTVRDYGPLMDRFSLLVLQAALAILMREPEFWYRLDNGDNLLFRREDFAAPETSRAFALLAQSRDGEVRAAAQVLRDACNGPLARVPLAARVLPLP
jgi:Serine/threonine protein kinase